MGYYFLLSCVGLGAGVAVWIADCADVESGLVMVAYYMEWKMTINWSYFIILSLEIAPMLNIAKIPKKWVTTQR